MMVAWSGPQRLCHNNTSLQINHAEFTLFNFIVPFPQFFIMNFLVAVADPDPSTADRITAAVYKATREVPYMLGRTQVVPFDLLAECEAAVAQRADDCEAPFSVVFANTDTLPDYTYPLQKMGLFSSVIKVSNEPEMKILFHKQTPSDYLTFPLSTKLISRILRSCCAVNRLSPEYVTLAPAEAPAMDPRHSTASAPRPKRKGAKKGAVASLGGKRREQSRDCGSLLRGTGASATAARNIRGFVYAKDLLALPLDDQNFTTGLLNPDTGAEYPAKASEPLLSPFMAGKMILSYDCASLDLRILRADGCASTMLGLDTDGANVDMTGLFGFSTSHHCVQTIQQAIVQSVPLEKYITLYAGEKAVPVYMLLTPVTRGVSPGGIGIAVASLLEAGFVGLLRLRAQGMLAN